MSIATEIKRLRSAKADIKTAIENKSVTVGNGTIDTYAKKIDEISAGGKTKEILERSVVDINDENITSIGEHALYSCRQLKTAIFPNVTSVGVGAFQGCASLTTVELPKATEVNIYGFHGCGFKTINLPLVKSIVDRAFAECPNLTSAYFPSVEHIGHYAFSGSSKLKTVDFPKATYIGDYVFYTCNSLDTLIMRTSAVCTLFTSNSFSYTPIARGTGYIYVPDNLVESYKVATNWSKFASQIKSISELEG